VLVEKDETISRYSPLGNSGKELERWYGRRLQAPKRERKKRRVNRKRRKELMRRGSCSASGVETRRTRTIKGKYYLRGGGELWGTVPQARDNEKTKKNKGGETFKREGEPSSSEERKRDVLLPLMRICLRVPEEKDPKKLKAVSTGGGPKRRLE